jgi:hypothetical protein
MAQSWCPVCCTRHDLGPKCPGELLADEPERHGWRVTVTTGQRQEHYSILVAPSGDLWRARIVTLPNILWSVPGGRGAMRFVAQTASEAEQLAREFVRDVCARKKYKIVDTPQVERAEPIDSEPAGPAADHGAENARFLHSISIRFGIETASTRTATADLSKQGLFVVTNRPLPKGTKVKLMLELEHAMLPLTGTVAWVRATPEEGRQAGFGVQLESPPALYEHYLKQLQ